MAEYNVTALLQQLRAEEENASAPPDEESMNAGYELPTDDLLTTEVDVDPKSIVDLIPREDQTDQESAVLESLHTELSYLREDIMNARGMSQTLAQEAINILPNFGNGKSLSFYSKHPSQTRFTASLEEIDENLLNNTVRYLEKLDYKISQLAAPADYLTPEARREWASLRQILPAFGVALSDGIRTLKQNGIDWVDQEMLAKALATYPTEYRVGPFLEKNLLTGAGPLAAFSDKTDYYQLGQQMPFWLDQFAEAAGAWDAALTTYVAELDLEGSGNLPKFEIPTFPTMALPGGGTISEDKLASAIGAAEKEIYTYQSKNIVDITLDKVLYSVGDAVQYAPVVGIFDRVINLKDAIDAHRASVQELCAKIATLDKYSDLVARVSADINKFATKLYDMYQVYNYFLDCVTAFVAAFRKEVKTLLAASMVVAEAADQVLCEDPEATLRQNEEALTYWKKQMVSMRESASFLC